MATIPEAYAIALEHYHASRLQDAEHICRQILEVAANHPDALQLLGVINLRIGNYQGAAEHFQCALAAHPNWADAHCNLGIAFKSQGKLNEASACYRRALQLKPDYAAAHNNLGDVHLAEGNLEEAVGCFRKALALNPDFFDALYNLGNALYSQGKLDDAAFSLQRAVQRNPGYAAAHNVLGVVFKSQGRLNEAATCYRRALQLKPDLASAHNNLGVVYKTQGQLDEAAACYRRALQLKPDYESALCNLGSVLEAQEVRDEAAACYRQVLLRKPNLVSVRCQLVHQLQQMCAWDDLNELSARVIQSVEADVDVESSAPVLPFSFLTLPIMTTAKQQLRCAERWAKDEIAPRVSGRRLAFQRPVERRSKITIGYLSADFRVHATALLVAELFEKHDRDRFEIVGYSYGRDDGSPMRQRLVKAFDRFVEVNAISSEDAARRIAADGIDILVDLKGYTGLARTEILAYRPAPIQVNYLGYPGTMGASFMDYILVDDFVVPPDQQPFFTEKLVHLPDCYQVNDSRREIAAQTPSRGECGLPEEGFVFCSFNNNYKITADVFDVWMRLLNAIPGSVLWLLEGNRFVHANLCREAEARGISRQRLIFAPRCPAAQHLARHRLAELFLDTFPVNAHTTASDALWAGCPLLTIAGETLVSRVAASLLRAIGLPELMTKSLAEYEAMALRLARELHFLGELRARLAENRTTSRLFDAGPFARNLEEAYRTMWEIHASGEKPRPFALAQPEPVCRQTR